MYEWTGKAPSSGHELEDGTRMVCWWSYKQDVLEGAHRGKPDEGDAGGAACIGASAFT